MKEKHVADPLKRRMRLTGTVSRLYDKLVDGDFHSQEELMTVLWDELSGKDVLNTHMYQLRLRLKTVGMGIGMLRENGVIKFRMVRVLQSDE